MTTCFCILNQFRQVSDAEMQKATSDVVSIKCKIKQRDPISEEDEAFLREKGIFGCNSAKSLLRTIYFYNGKLFGLHSKEKLKILKLWHRLKIL